MELSKLYEAEKLNVLVYGDWMIDEYIIGSVSRISPEAPIPVLKVNEKSKKLGGAGNVVCNLISLGAHVRVLGILGNDENGIWILNKFKEINADTRFLKKGKYNSTIVKTRVVSKNQQYIRFDKEENIEMSRGGEEFFLENINVALNGIDTVVISDYAKGTVTHKVTQKIIAECRKNNIYVFVDPKGDDFSKYSGATICTPNVKEMQIVTSKKLNIDRELEAATINLCKDIDFNYIAVTRSEKGILLCGRDGKVRNFPAVPKEVVDVSGAGDTVLAIMAISISVGYSVDEACQLANYAASIVCSKFSTSTVTIGELFYDIEQRKSLKIMNIDELKNSVEILKNSGKKIVFTNGCFDLLHSGHLASFYKAKEYGDILIVAVNSDCSVKKQKGPKRPVIDEVNRMKMVSALECVDYVVLMKDDNPIEILKSLKPDIVVKGKDWEFKKMPEREIILRYGGDLKFVELEKGLSTTQIIHRIMETNCE